MKNRFLEIGKIVGTHGVKGMVRIQPWSDSGDFLTNFKEFYLDQDGRNRIEIEQIQPHKTVVLAKLKGVDSIESAEKLRNRVLYADRAAIPLPEGRYFVVDLIGCDVFDPDGKTLGAMRDVSQTGANDVWHIERGGKEYLVPAIAEVIVSVDVEERKIVLNPMKGIFDDAD